MTILTIFSSSIQKIEWGKGFEPTFQTMGAKGDPGESLIQEYF